MSCQGRNGPDLGLPYWRGQRDCWGDSDLSTSTIIRDFQYDPKSHPIHLHIYITHILCFSAFSFPLCVSPDVLVVLKRVAQTHSSGILSLSLVSMLSFSFVNLIVTWYEQKQRLIWGIDLVENKLVASESGGKANNAWRRAVVVLRV